MEKDIKDILKKILKCKKYYMEFIVIFEMCVENDLFEIMLCQEKVEECFKEQIKLLRNQLCQLRNQLCQLRDE